MSVPDDRTAWALALFRRSVLKRAKWREIERLLGPPPRRGLDVGADNGVVSLLLRRRGGAWASADLDERTVASIRSLVGGEVHRIGDGPLPFADGEFDQVVLVDYLEHVADDAGAVREFARVLRPGGSLIVNVPHLVPRSLLARLRHRVGLTDAWHGHVRPGYDRAGLAALLAPAFRLERARTYSRAFSEALDTLLNAAYIRRAGTAAGTKGSVVTGEDVARHGTAFRALGLAYPAMRAFAACDALLPLHRGYRLVARAVRVPAEAPVRPAARAAHPGTA